LVGLEEPTSWAEVEMTTEADVMRATVTQLSATVEQLQLQIQQQARITSEQDRTNRAKELSRVVQVDNFKNETKDEWKVFERSLKGVMRNVDGTWPQMMMLASQTTVPILIPAEQGPLECSNFLYSVLTSKVKCKIGSKIIGRVDDGHGLEAYRLLCKQYEHGQDESQAVAQLGKLMQWKFGNKLDEVPESLASFLEQMRCWVLMIVGFVGKCFRERAFDSRIFGTECNNDCEICRKTMFSRKVLRPWFEDFWDKVRSY